jgi:hypothetical protein
MIINGACNKLLIYLKKYIYGVVLLVGLPSGGHTKEG